MASRPGPVAFIFVSRRGTGTGTQRHADEMAPLPVSPEILIRPQQLFIYTYTVLYAPGTLTLPASVLMLEGPLLERAAVIAYHSSCVSLVRRLLREQAQMQSAARWQRVSHPPVRFARVVHLRRIAPEKLDVLLKLPDALQHRLRVALQVGHLLRNLQQEDTGGDHM